jgi:hypothetical protein
MSRVAAIALAFVVAGCQEPLRAPTGLLDSSPTTASGPVMDNQWSPISFVAANTCLGESIAVSGKAHISTSVWSDAERLRVRGHINLNLVGVGLATGRVLQLMQISSSDFELDVTSGASASDQVFILNVITRAGEPNAYVTMNGTFIVDPGGGTQFFPKKWTFTCR